MSRTEDREKVQDRVFDLLKGLRGEHQLKELCRELNYQHSNTPLSSRRWRSAPKRLVDEKRLETPVLLGSAGKGDDFHIIYTRLRTADLRLGHERQVVSQLLQEHPYALFVFSNDQQDRWHFLNVKYYREQGRHSRIFRRIAIGGHNRLHTAAQRLSMLDLETLDNATPLDIQTVHDEAFDVEAVTVAFFQSYKQIFDDLQRELLRQTRNRDRRWAHDYVLQFLNRIMFLYFIQRKGWLGNETEFLRTYWQSYDCQQNRDAFFDRWLKILFFESFNRPFHGRNGKLAHLSPKIREAVKQAPYLNGGLFKSNELDDTGQHHFLVTDKMFEQVFNFLEKHNFTIAEDSPLDQEVAVDPEMIGRVYESLVNVSVEAEEQGDAGIFYTPRTEIDLMCRLALVDNLANHLGQQHKPLFYEAIFALEEDEKEAADQKLAITRLWPQVAAHLRQLTILDPACGSGSFLVGMLHILNDLQRRASNQVKQEETEFDRKKRIIAENLYGVEVMKWATHVTELRLWLALIVDAPFSLAELQKQNEPLLPHFTFRIRQGDSLVQEVGGVNLGHKRAAFEIPKEIAAQLDHLKKEKLKFYYSEAGGQIHSEKEARRYEHKIFLAILQRREEMLQQKLKTLRQKISGPQSRQLRLDGSVELRSHQLDLRTAEWQLQLESIQADLESITRTRAALGRDVPAERFHEDYFVWDVAFAEIFAGEKNGFDIVIGNPPYVRQEKIADPRLASDDVTKENKQAYKAKLARSVYQAFPTYFGYIPVRDAATRKLDAKSDLYIYFYFHALSLLNPRGSFCFITSNSWLDVGYGAELQEFLLKHCHVKLILDNQVQRTFGQADVNTVIVLFSAPDEAREWGLEQTARFVMFKQPFDSVASASIFQQIESINVRQATSDFRIHPDRQQNLLADGSETAHGSQACQPEHRTSGKTVKRKPDFAHICPLIKVERYLGDKWGGKYLRAPDIYWTILKKGKGKLVRLGDIAEVRFGIKTGANEFFYLDEARIREWGIEREFLKPVIKSPRECKRILIDPKDLKYKIFMCHKDKKDLKSTAALEYIKWGEAQGFHERPSCAGRARWWDLGNWDYAHLLWVETMFDAFRVYRNANNIHESDKFYGISTAFHPDNLTTLLNSTIVLLWKLLSGFASLGQGALKTAVYEVKNIQTMHPGICTIPPNLTRAFIAREIQSIKVELNMTDRRTIDNTIFDALGLTQDEQDAVYEAVIDLVESRLKKADSFKSNNHSEHEDDEKMEASGAGLRRPMQKAEKITRRAKVA